jgi:D-alanyl-D-alanine carboxypeptidase
MVLGSFKARRGARRYFLIAVSAAAVIVTSSGADAWDYGSTNRINNDQSANLNTHAREYLPPSASIVVDGTSGAVLQASNPDALRHPASLTKIMTLYLLFERLKTRGIRLDTPLKVSEHASEQAPTKLGLHAGQSITVEDAIKGMVTKSANDAAVVVAENLGGDEVNFAKLMTQRARALGMTRTTYMNASGLPDDNQVTTARDQALLGRTIQEHFPSYYKYFSTELFVYHGEEMRNHNHLLGSVDGVDGIKTGFTRASGFNLVTSVHRGGRYIVAVVMGGHSSIERDAHMRELISVHIKQASLRGSRPVVVQHDRHQSLASADVPPAAEPADIQPLIEKTIILQAAPEQSTSSAAMPPWLSNDAPNQLPNASQANAQVATRWPSNLEVFASVGSAPNAMPSVQATAVGSEPAREVEAEPPASGHAHGGWLIQIGAFDGENEAKERLTAARLKMHEALLGNLPITERVQKGHKTVYRARFAGFDKASAESACKQLKRSAFDCIALQN